MINFKKYYTSLISIATPIILGNIAHILIGTGDVLIASRHSVETLSAISIGNAIMMCLFIVGIGLMSGITPVISNYLGSGHASKKYLLSTINFSLIMSSLFCLITLLVVPFIDLFGFDTSITPAIKKYIFIVAFSYFGAYLHFALKEFLQAYEILAFPNFLSAIAVILNIGFNIIFVFGFGPIPSMGATGLAIATVLIRSIMGLALLLYCYKKINFKLKLDLIYTKQLLKVGYPIAIALLLEFLAFNAVTVLAGREASIYAAVQSLLMTITSIVFMVPLAMSNAIAIKIGYANGAKNYIDLKNYSITGIIITTGFMILCAILLFVFPKEILSLLSTDKTLLDIAIPILMVVAIFQLFDGLQVSFGGILKGLKKTIFVSTAILCGYWLVGFPLGLFFAYVLKMNLIGFWIGLAISILTMSIFMGIVLLIMFKKLKIKYSN